MRHTACHRGRRVLIVLRDGARVEDKFLNRTDKWVSLELYGKVYKRDIRSFTVLNRGVSMKGESHATA